MSPSDKATENDQLSVALTGGTQDVKTDGGKTEACPTCPTCSTMKSAWSLPVETHDDEDTIGRARAWWILTTQSERRRSKPFEDMTMIPKHTNKGSILDWNPSDPELLRAKLTMGSIMMEQDMAAIRSPERQTLTEEQWIALAAQHYQSELKNPGVQWQQTLDPSELSKLSTFARIAEMKLLARHWRCQDGEEAEVKARLHIKELIKSKDYNDSPSFLKLYYANCLRPTANAGSPPSSKAS